MHGGARLALAAVVAVGALSAGDGGVARADTLRCPDLAAAEQVGNCPSLRELRILFGSTCGGEANPDAAKPGLCDSFEEFQRQRATALWEAGEAGFAGYLPCALTAKDLAAGRLAAVAVAGKRVTRITCTYAGAGDGPVTLTLRRRGACALPSGAAQGRADCTADPAACAVDCK
ncbi:MAG: hypothetical protein H6906_13330 [Hyphomicrobiales bacterium]|nr:hypothetical protein [Hyphomicrobiales bacterium]